MKSFMYTMTSACSGHSKPRQALRSTQARQLWGTTKILHYSAAHLDCWTMVPVHTHACMHAHTHTHTNTHTHTYTHTYTHTHTHTYTHTHAHTHTHTHTHTHIHTLTHFWNPSQDKNADVLCAGGIHAHIVEICPLRTTNHKTRIQTATTQTNQNNSSSRRSQFDSKLLSNSKCSPNVWTLPQRSGSFHKVGVPSFWEWQS